MAKKSKYKGVHWDYRTSMWRSAITIAGESHTCGRSKDDREAAVMRDLYIIKMKLDKPIYILKPLPNKIGTFD